QGGIHKIDVVGALHGELQPLAMLDELVPLDDLASKLARLGVPDPLLALGKFGTAHQLYIPWMQASYIMWPTKRRCPICPRARTSTHSATTSSLPGLTRSRRRPASRCLAFRRGRKG